MSNTLARLLLRKEELSTEAWMEILEACKEKLNPHLDKFTMPKFGDLACMDNQDGFYRRISRDNPREIGPLDLSEHGIIYFEDTGERLKERDTTRTMKAYGLSKRGEWVVVTITVELLPSEAGHPDWEHAKSVCVDIVSLGEMLRQTGVHPIKVLNSIVLEVSAWERRRKALYESATCLAGEFRLLQEFLIHTSI